MATEPIYFVIQKDSVEQWAFEHFKGWHFQTATKDQKTAYAAVAMSKNNTSSKNAGQKELEKHIRGTKAINIRNPPKGSFEDYVAILHNRGTTLQTKASNMVLTRPLRVLVKGASRNHIATVCNVENYIVTTEAHKVAETKAVTDVIQEAQKQAANPALRNTLYRLKTCSPCKLGKLKERETAHMRRLKETPTIEQLLQCNPKISTATCAILVQSAAVIITAYEDAGSKFRDRASRQQAATALGQAIRTILETPL